MMKIRTAPALFSLALAVGLAACGATREFLEDTWDFLGFGGSRRGELEEGLQEGDWSYYYANGELSSQGRYEEDKQVGEWRAYYENGRPKFRGSYLGGYRNGLWTYWHATGSRKAMGYFVDGREEGQWTFWHEGGVLESQGDYHEALQSLGWTYWHSNGATRAWGHFLEGEKVGVWRYRKPSGESAGEREYPLPTGWEIARESWDDGSPKREGFLFEGRPQGRWASWRENGSRKLSGEFSAGLPSGSWQVVGSDGDPVAMAQVVAGARRGELELLFESREGSAPDPDQDGANTDPRSFLDVELRAIASPLSVVLDEAAQGAAPQAAEEEAVEQKREAPIEAPGWTVREEISWPEYVDAYGPNPDKLQVDDWGLDGGYVPPTTSSRGDPLREDLKGKPMPRTVFTSWRNERVDLRDFVGKRVVVVVLRGMVGRGREVCVYCTTQTVALVNAESHFERQNAEVILVFPGPAAGVEAFRQAIASAGPEFSAIPYHVVLDAKERLVEGLDIPGDLAAPTSLILDEAGVVRWAYEGLRADDRPSVERLVEELEKLGS